MSNSPSNSTVAALLAITRPQPLNDMFRKRIIHITIFLKLFFPAISDGGDAKGYPSIEGTKWAITESGMYYTIEFLPEGNATIVDPARDTRDAKWIQSGEELRFWVIGGFNLRTGSYDGVEIAGFDMFDRWTGSRIENPESNPNQEPRLILGFTLNLKRGLKREAKGKNAVIELDISSEGLVTNVNFEKSISKKVDKAIVRTVNDWVFSPLVVDGKTMACKIRVPFNISSSPMEMDAIEENRDSESNKRDRYDHAIDAIKRSL